MAAITNPGNIPTEFAGDFKLLNFNELPVTTASDTLTLTEADNKILTIENVVGSISGGQDAAFTALEVSFDGLVITINSVEQDGTPATDFTDATVNLMVICT